MKKITLTLSVIALSAICSTGVIAQASNSATATSGGTAITPITVSNSRDLNFGVFAVTATTGGSIIVAGDNSTPAQAINQVTIATVGGDAPTSAQFDVAGDSNFTYTFTIAETTFDITGADATTTLAVTDLTSSLGDPNAGAIGTLSAGSQTVYVGGTLTIPAATVPQIYTVASAFNATVDYN
ncbi:MAG: hypothetical protein ACI87N_003337 [Flavobacteriales bacterium]|jgi:hypothetical protein